MFVSASADWMDHLEREGLIAPGTRRDAAGNALVLIGAPDAAPVALGTGALAGRLAGGHLAMAMVDAVPAGIYGRAALRSLGEWDAVAPRVAQTDNVRAALALVALGEARMGVVYATDAAAEPRVATLATFPEGSHPPHRLSRRAHRRRRRPRGRRRLPRPPLRAGGPRRARRRRLRAPAAVTAGLGPAEWAAVALSLRISAVATLASLPFGILAAYALARWRFPGRGALNLAVHLPLVLPPVVTGYLLLLTFGTRGPVGSVLADIGIVLAFEWTGAALAAAIMAFPLMVRAIRLSIEAVDPQLERAAATLGASPPRVFATVTLPLILPGVLAGGILAFAKAMGEFGATITFVSNIPGRTQTVPSAIYALLQVPGGEGAALRLVALSVLLALGALVASEALAARAARRTLGA